MQYCPQCRAELASRLIDGIERRACECGFVFWNNPVPVVAALVEHEGRVVLARNAAWPEGKFGLITGFLEGGETPEQGVLREVEEELGLAAELVGFIGVYSFFKLNQLILAYHVRGAGSIQLNAELAEARHVVPEQLVPWDYGTGPAVRDWLARRD